jgi:hypothetical protein
VAALSHLLTISLLSSAEFVAEHCHGNNVIFAGNWREVFRRNWFGEMSFARDIKKLFLLSFDVIPYPVSYHVSDTFAILSCDSLIFIIGKPIRMVC